jgi:CubicO group peptidase (beta-lactamase class C family)
MKTRIAVPILLVGYLLSRSPAALADPLPATQPQTVGLSKERLNRIPRPSRPASPKGIPGAVLLISRHGKIATSRPWAASTREEDAPVKDAIFRIYSMSKPIVTVAAMMLFEEGKLALSDPVAKYIPAFKDVKVGEEKKGPDGKATLELVAPTRAMTIQDLMRHSSGLTYGFFGEGLVKKAYVAAKLGDGDPTAAEFVDRLSSRSSTTRARRGTTASRPMCSAG